MATTGAGTGRAVGQSASSASSRNTATRLLNIIRRRKGLPDVADMVYGEIENEHLNNLFLIIARFLSINPVPKYFNDELKPRNPDNKKCNQPITIVKYFGQMKEVIKEKFPQHPDFAHSTLPYKDPVWWSSLLAGFEKDVNRLMIRLSGSEDIVFGDNTTAPLYRTNHRLEETVANRAEEHMWFIETTGSQVINDYVSLIDMKYITRQLMRNARPIGTKSLQHRAWLVVLFLACGRGGEIKFVDFSEWQFLPSIEVLDTSWTELKVLEKYSMGFVPDRDSYLLDIYHALGCYFAMERGLFRHPDQLKKSLGNYLFPDLHSMPDKSVTTAVTAVIRGCLPTNIPASAKAHLSAKSTRYGAVSQMAVHPQCDLFETVARSGHATGINIDYYTDKKNPERSLPGARVLSGWKDAYAPNRVPRLESIGYHNKAAVRRLMDVLFVVSVDYFKPGKQLFVVLKIITASLIMYHQQVTLDLGPSNAVSTFMRDAARKAAVTDPQFPNIGPEATLMEWSKIVRKDFKSINPEISNAKADLNTMASAINQMSALISTLNQEVIGLKSVAAQKDAHFERLVGQMQTHYDEETASLKNEIAGLRHKLAFIRTPPQITNSSPAVASRLPTRPAVTSERNIRRRLNPPTDDSAVVAPPATQSSPVVVQPPTEETPVVTQPVELTFGSESKFLADNGSNKDLQISQVTEWLHVKNYTVGLKSPYDKHCSVPTFIKEKSHFRFFLELLEYAVSDDDKAIITKSSVDTDQETRLKTYQSIRKAMMEKLNVFEKKDPELDKQLKKTTKKPSPTLCGVARRVALYKKKIHGNRADGTTWSEMKLCEPDEIEGPGTPKGHRNVASYFPRKEA